MNPTLRNVLAALLGYVVIVVIVFAAFSLLWNLLGPEGAFQPESYAVSGVWVTGSIVLGFVAALLGGVVCARAAADSRAELILIGLIVILGVIAALPETAEVAGPRPEDIAMADAMMSAQMPRWVAWLNPVIGVLGVWLGGAIGARRTP